MIGSVYIDHNVVDDISKGNISLPPSDEFYWVYSSEHFEEIYRSGDTRFLDVLENIDAIYIQLEVDNSFQLTGKASFHSLQSPRFLYDEWLENNSKKPFDMGIYFKLISVFFGGEFSHSLHDAPEGFSSDMHKFLRDIELYSAEWRSQIDSAKYDLQKIIDLVKGFNYTREEQRAHFGLNGGRAGMLADEENPIPELWQAMNKEAPELLRHVSIDEFFGFNTSTNLFQEHNPLYLGIVGCYAVLNMIGYRPDEKLSKLNKTPGVLSDAAHVGHAAYCNGLLSMDMRLCDKAKAIYKYKDIGTRVIYMKKFKRNDSLPT